MRNYVVALLACAAFAVGCSGGSSDPVLSGDEPGGSNPPPANPPPTLPPPSPPPPPSGPSFDPEFNEPQNLIEVNYDNAKSTEENGDILESAIENLDPGDRLVIGSGTYTMDSRLSVSIDGTEANPVSIEAADGAAVRIHRPLENQNLIDIDRASYLTIKGIEWTGGSLGIRFIDCHHIYFYNNNVHDTGDAAVTANSSDTHHLYFIDNHVHHTNGYGEGFYLGANNAVYITHHTLVVGNHIHDTGPRQGDGVEIKHGSYACLISDNLIENTNYPGVLVYGTDGQAERNIIERNVIIGSAQAGIQVAADAVVRNNLIIDCVDTCIRSQPHQGATPSNLTIVHNTLINTGQCLSPVTWTGTGIVFANNVMYSDISDEIQDPTQNATVSGNVILDDLTAFAGVTLDGAARDAKPLVGSDIIGAGDSDYAVADDLHGAARTGVLDSGAVDAD
ncbi:MAG: right-handed parallel beta-helix repeat-containing protein [Planctomycetota bacterium]